MRQRGVGLCLLFKLNVAVSRRRSDWVPDLGADTTIYGTGSEREGRGTEVKGKGFFRNHFDEVAVFYCYFSPDRERQDSESFSEVLGQSLEEHIGRKFVTMNDFN